MQHELKTWPEYFEAIVNGAKRFEVRQNDRNFKVGDTLLLKEYDPKKGRYTGRALIAGVSYFLDGGQFGIQVGFCVMSIYLIELTDHP